MMFFWGGVGRIGEWSVGGGGGGFVLRTTSVSPLDRDKDTLSLTREKCIRIFPLSMKG